MPAERPLPISTRTDRPSFDIGDILRHDELTERFDCSFEMIQQLLIDELGHKIPGSPNPKAG